MFVLKFELFKTSCTVQSKEMGFHKVDQLAF